MTINRYPRIGFQLISKLSFLFILVFLAISFSVSADSISDPSTAQIPSSDVHDLIFDNTGNPILLDSTPPLCSVGVVCTDVYDISCDASLDPDIIGYPQVVLVGDCADYVYTLEYSDETTAGDCPNAMTVIRNWKMYDEFRFLVSSCDQSIYVVDTTSPELTVPQSRTVLLCGEEEVCYQIITSDNCDPDPTLSIVSGPGVISNGQWCYTPHQAGSVVVTIRSEDACGNYTEDTFIINFEFNRPPVANCPGGGNLLLCDLETNCISGFSYSDPDNNIADVQIIGGILVGQALCFDPVEGINTITMIVIDECGLADTCETVYEVELNRSPQISCLNDTTVHWGDTYTGTITSFDPNTSQDIFFSVGEGAPPAMTFNSSTGLIQWNTTGADVCSHTIEIIASDECGAADTCSFTICVTNDPPVIICPEEANTTCWGGVVGGSVIADDPDNGPSPLRYRVASFDGPGVIDLNSVTGEWSWTTLEENDYTGTFNLCIEAYDNANICEGCSSSNADTCCVSIHVKPVRKVYIESKELVLNGQIETIRIYQDSTVRGGIEMGGFDFLISYDPSVLQFTAATEGQLLKDCGWEYFTYRCGPACNCAGSACPSGIARITAIAEMNDNGSHPSCFEGTSGTLVNIDFYVTNDRTTNCMLAPIKWIWYDCGDNTISSVTGDTLFISRNVYQLGGDNQTGYIQIDDYNAQFPTEFGAPIYCETQSDPGKPTPNRCGIDFYGGGIRIICINEYDDRADINFNNIPYEISDAVLFSNFFVYGLKVFDISQEGQIAATDVNADGITLSVADLVYLIRVIIGDAKPMPKYVSPYQVYMTHDDEGVVSIEGNKEIGAAAITVKGDAHPVLLADEMQMMYNYDGTETKILIYSLEGNSFSGAAVQLDGEIESIDIADRDGVTVNPKLVPTDYLLMQNYPNPFNPTTTFSFVLPVASGYTLTIYNVNGQVISKIEGNDQAGRVEIEWDASQLASGIYFYRLEAGSFSDTKKMILLK